MKSSLSTFFFGLCLSLAVLAPPLGIVIGLERGAREAFAADGDKNQKTGATDSVYDTDRQYKAFRSGLAVVDSFTTTYVLGTPAFHVGGRTTLYLASRFTQAGQSCTVQVAYVYRLEREALSDTDVASYTLLNGDTAAGNTIKDWSHVYTLTGSSTQKEGSYYEAPAIPIDTERASTLRILLVTTPASGTVSFWPGS